MIARRCSSLLLRRRMCKGIHVEADHANRLIQLADMTRPELLYPVARQMRRRIVYHGPS